jgi:tRNA threonylcarbamoyladenosine biosynthesis protein TsaE
VAYDVLIISPGVNRQFAAQRVIGYNAIIMDSHILTEVSELEGVSNTLVSALAAAAFPVSATVVALHGDLGAGKTTLVQAVARTLGIVETVTSPTFVVMKHYGTEHADFTTLVHIDAYRIETDDEMRPLGFTQLLMTPHTLICIEWAERIANLLPDTTMHITLELNPDGTRTLTYGNKK